MAAASPSPSEQAARVFELYGLAPSFEIDLRDLEDRLRQASLAWHPDRFALQGEAARLEAEDKMAEFNDAFPLLRDPARRAELLLNWLGVAPTQGTDAEADPAFLMAMMELREEAEAARTQLTQDAAPAQQFIQRMQQAEAELLERFHAAFAELPEEARAGAGTAEAANQDPPHPQLAALRRLFYELRYHQRSREQLQDALRHDGTQIP